MNKSLQRKSMSTVRSWLMIPLSRVMFSLVFVSQAMAVNYIVTNNGDAGGVSLCDGIVACSLRQSILAANATVGVPDIISFNIPGAGVQTITPATPLPNITDPVTIDGFSQPGAAPGNLLIEINGINTPPGTNGLVLGANSS